MKCPNPLKMNKGENVYFILNFVIIKSPSCFDALDSSSLFTGLQELTSEERRPVWEPESDAGKAKASLKLCARFGFQLCRLIAHFRPITSRRRECFMVIPSLNGGYFCLR